MSNYVKSTNFTAKDSLPTGDTNKVIRGSEFDTEFDAIATATGTKADLAGPTFTGTATFADLTATGTVNLTGATVSNLGTVTTVDIDGGTIDGATIGANSASTGNFTTLSINGTAITSTAAELNILDGVTASTAEINLLDGVTATTAELNILDGVTATAVELNTLDGITATTAELNILDGKTFLDEDDMVSDSATGIPSQQSVKAYVDAQAGGGTLDNLTDTNITTPADGAVLFYDTTTSKWIDNVVSGDITIADTGVAAIGAGVIVNADVNASAAIDVSKTALTAGTGLTLTTNTLSVDAAQTQITSVGTLSSLSVSGTLTLGGTDITSTAAELNILDGVTATTAEINYLDVTTLGTTEASKAVTADANGVVTFDNGISEEYTAVTSSSNATTVNLRDGTNFSHTLTENTTFTFSNPASSGKVSAFTLKIVQDASASGYTVTWPGSVDWPSATAPTLTATASAVDYFVFITHDGGTTYYGFTAGQALG